MNNARAEVLASATFPRAHWTKIWPTQPFEGFNGEVKRRAGVVGIFQRAAVIRLVGMVLADTNDDWTTDERRYLSKGSVVKPIPETDIAPTDAITGSGW